jgi:hypothetical protein
VQVRRAARRGRMLRRAAQSFRGRDSTPPNYGGARRPLQDRAIPPALAPSPSHLTIGYVSSPPRAPRRRRTTRIVSGLPGDPRPPFGPDLARDGCQPRRCDVDRRVLRCRRCRKTSAAGRPTRMHGDLLPQGRPTGEGGLSCGLTCRTFACSPRSSAGLARWAGHALPLVLLSPLKGIRLQQGEATEYFQGVGR